MAIRHAKKTITDEATLIADASNDREGFLLKINNPSGGVTVYLGASGVTTTAGYPMVTGTSLEVRLLKDEKIYGIIASGNQDIFTLSQGN